MRTSVTPRPSIWLQPSRFPCHPRPLQLGSSPGVNTRGIFLGAPISRSASGESINTEVPVFSVPNSVVNNIADNLFVGAPAAAGRARHSCLAPATNAYRQGVERRAGARRFLTAPQTKPSPRESPSRPLQISQL